MIPIKNSKVPVDHRKEALHMDSVDLDLMVRPLVREDHQVDMVRVLLEDNLKYIFIFWKIISRINLDIEVDIDDIEDLVDNQGVADSQNNRVGHMAAYRVVDKDPGVVDNLGELDNLKETFWILLL